MSAATLLYSRDGRLRAPIRIVAFVVASVLAFAVVQGLLYPLLVLGTGLTGTQTSLEQAMFVIALLLAHLAMFRWIERDRSWPFVWMGDEAARPRPIAVGLTIGAACIAIPSLLLLAAGLLRIERVEGSVGWMETAWRSAVFLLPAAMAEELMIRGYPFAVLRETVGARGALLGTSLVFGVMHAWNPGANILSILLVTLAGLFLGGVVLVTQSLYAATVAHFAWNWVMAGFLHTPVSGLSEFAPAGYRLTDAGPDWITGGPWGPEGGIGAAVGMSAGLWYLFSRPGAGRLLQRFTSREERQA